MKKLFAILLISIFLTGCTGTGVTVYDVKDIDYEDKETSGRFIF